MIWYICGFGIAKNYRFDFPLETAFLQTVYEGLSNDKNVLVSEDCYFMKFYEVNKPLANCKLQLRLFLPLPSKSMDEHECVVDKIIYALIYSLKFAEQRLKTTYALLCRNLSLLGFSVPFIIETVGGVVLTLLSHSNCAKRSNDLLLLMNRQKNPGVFLQRSSQNLGWIDNAPQGQTDELAKNSFASNGKQSNRTEKKSDPNW